MDTKTAPKLLHIFKPGRHVTAAGEAIEFSAADLEATARAYDPALHKAPLVIGHPKLDDPAQGWAASLSAQPRGLYAAPMKVDPEFAESVNAGRYGTISSKFYRPDDASNPVPGVWYLRHVGFLGATAPAVKGMDDPEFSEDDGCVCFREGVEFSGWSEQQNSGLWRRLREWIIGKHGLEEADNVIPDYAVANLEAEARQVRAEESKAVPAFSEPQPKETVTVTPEEAAALGAKNAQLQKELEALQAKANKDAADKRHADNVAFAESLTGKLKPEQRNVVLATLDHLGNQDAPVEFGEGDAKKPLAEAFKGLLGDLPDLVEFSEVATKNNAATGAAKDVEFAAPSGYTVDNDRLALHQKAMAHADQHKVSYDVALAAVSR